MALDDAEQVHERNPVLHRALQPHILVVTGVRPAVSVAKEAVRPDAVLVRGSPSFLGSRAADAEGEFENRRFEDALVGDEGNPAPVEVEASEKDGPGQGIAMAARWESRKVKAAIRMAWSAERSTGSKLCESRPLVPGAVRGRRPFNCSPSAGLLGEASHGRSEDRSSDRRTRPIAAWTNTSQVTELHRTS